MGGVSESAEEIKNSKNPRGQEPYLKLRAASYWFAPESQEYVFSSGILSESFIKGSFTALFRDQAAH